MATDEGPADALSILELEALLVIAQAKGEERPNKRSRKSTAKALAAAEDPCLTGKKGKGKGKELEDGVTIFPVP
jgi:hypothetical protein